MLSKSFKDVFCANPYFLYTHKRFILVLTFICICVNIFQSKKVYAQFDWQQQVQEQQRLETQRSNTEYWNRIDGQQGLETQRSNTEYWNRIDGQQRLERERLERERLDREYWNRIDEQQRLERERQHSCSFLDIFNGRCLGNL